MKLKTPVFSGLIILAGLSVAAGLAYFNRWQLAVFSFIPVLATLLGVILMVLVLLFRRRTKAQTLRRRHSFNTTLLLISLFFVLQLAFFPLAQTFRNGEVQRAQAMLESLIPQLEDYKRRHADYPENISALLSADVTLPPLLQLSGSLPVAYDNRNFYRRRDTTYSFQFYVPDGFIGFEYSYCCGAEGTWTVMD
jgi:predicted PurR-regulated permease PerM